MKLKEIKKKKNIVSREDLIWKKIFHTYIISSRKSHTKIIHLRYILQHGMTKLNSLMDHIRYSIFKIILSASYKKLKVKLHLKLKLELINFGLSTPEKKIKSLGSA